MGSATNQALAETTAALAAARGVDLTGARERFVAARERGQTSQLSGALADSAAAPAARAKVITDVFGPSMAPATVGLLTNAVQQRWSSASDLIDGIEELAVRAATIASDADVESELFEFSRTVAANPELELALGSRLGDASAKGDLVAKLLTGRASEATVLVASSLVQQPRERRVRQLLSRAIRIVADERGRAVATVTAAAALSAEQASRLTELLSAGDHAAADELADDLQPLFGIVGVTTTEETPFGSVECKARNPLAIKTLMNVLGLPAGPCRRPLGRMTRNGVEVAVGAAREVYANNPANLAPIGEFFDVDVSARLHDENLIDSLLYADY